MRNHTKLFSARIVWMLLPGWICPSLALAATPAELSCPDSIPAASINLQALPPGWMPHIDGPLYLSSAAPIDGEPERKGQLVPGGTRKQKGLTVLSYRLEGDYPHGKWLQCRYGAYGEISLSKRLPDSISLCEIGHSKGQKAGQQNIQIVCR